MAWPLYNFLRKVNFPADFNFNPAVLSVRLSDCPDDIVKIEIDEPYWGDVEIALLMPPNTETLREAIRDLGFRSWAEASRPDMYTQLIVTDDPGWIKDLADVLRGYIQTASERGDHQRPDVDDVALLDRLAYVLQIFDVCVKADSEFQGPIFQDGTVAAATAE